MKRTVLDQDRLFFGLICIGALIMCGIFECGLMLSLPVSLCISLFTIWYGMIAFKRSKLPLLAGFFLLIYWVPFIHLLEYIYNPSIMYGQYATWGLPGNEYAFNIDIVRQVALIGAIGGGGLSAGFFLSQMNKSRKSAEIHLGVGSSLSFPSYLFIAIVALALSWMNAPAETILQASYTTVKSRYSDINFNAGGILSYIFTALLVIDANIEKNVKIKVLKIAVATFSTIIIVVWFQFMRGGRMCMGLIFAIVALSIKMGMSNSVKKNIMKKIIVCICFLVIFFIVGQYVGTIRSNSEGREGLTNILDANIPIFSGTWSLALCTPFSVIGDFYYGVMSQRWGSTYWDMFLSLPPGFITKWLDINRPFEADRGPAWEMRYSLGGTHAVVVPFMNFKSFGVFFVLLIYGIFIGKVELMTQHPNRWRLLLYATFFIMGFAWFWYGEMAAVRGLMSFVVVWATYRVLPKAC